MISETTPNLDDLELTHFKSKFSESDLLYVTQIASRFKVDLYLLAKITNWLYSDINYKDYDIKLTCITIILVLYKMTLLYDFHLKMLIDTIKSIKNPRLNNIINHIKGNTFL